MFRRMLLALAGAIALGSCFAANTASADERAFGRVWGGQYHLRDWERFYHYPYIFYPQNFWGDEYYRSADDLYYRYPPEMRIPVYNKRWQNYYPQSRRYHSGHHFHLDIF